MGERSRSGVRERDSFGISISAARSRRNKRGSRPFAIFTGACTEGSGALSQEGADKLFHLIYLVSKGLSSAEKLRTDNQPLTALFKRSNVSARVLQWSLEPQRYNQGNQYVKRRANAVADALSRGAAK